MQTHTLPADGGWPSEIGLWWTRRNDAKNGIMFDYNTGQR